MIIDARIAYLVLVFAAVFAGGQAVTGLMVNSRTKRKANRRLAVAERTNSLEALVVELRRQRGLNAQGGRAIAWSLLFELATRSGVPFAPRRWSMVAMGLGVAGMAMAALATRNLWISLAAGPVFGLLIPIFWLKLKMAKRAKLLGEQLPAALEVVVRSLEAGHPVPTAVALVGREMADPIGSEFGMAADEIAYGATLEQAVGRMADRCSQPDVDLFAATVRLQEKAGGDLVGLLRLNAKAVRDRHKMRMKIKAASSEGRASAMILTSAPFCVLAILQVSSPQFYGEVIHARPVQYALAGLGLWMLLGNLIMRRMIDMRI